MVHDAAQAEQLSFLSELRAAALVAAVIAAAVVSGCGGSDSTPTPVGGLNLGVELRLADCDDWEAGTAAERLGTIAQIANYSGGPIGNAGGHGATMDPNRAYDVMEEYCSHSFAHGFKLYKLYTRAAATAPPDS